MVIAVHIAGLIDRFLEQRIPQQVAVTVAVFGEFHRPVAAFAAVGDVFIQLFFIDKTKYRRIVAPGLPRRRYLRRNFEAVVIAFGRHLFVGAKAGKCLLGLPFFHREQHGAVGGVVRLIAGRAIFRHAVTVMVAIAQPPVVIGHQLRIHLFQPRFIFGDVIYLHHRPGREAWLGVAFVPVAAVAAALGAQVPGDQIGHKSGILRAHLIIGFYLPGEDGADILFGDIRVEVGHGVGLFPGIPRPGLVAGEPAAGHGWGDGMVMHRAARRAPVAVERFNSFHRHAGLFGGSVGVAEPFLQIAVPALFGGGEIVSRARQNIADLRFFPPRLLRGE